MKDLSDYYSNLVHPFPTTDKNHQIKALNSPLITDPPHPLCLLAAKELQHYLANQNELQHNFGLAADMDGSVIGKMFGVLVIETRSGLLGYLSAFSGKLGGSNQHKKFVPPVFDSLKEGDFLNAGMIELKKLSEKITLLRADAASNQTQIESLKAKRKLRSFNLQQQLFQQYHFLNAKGISKSLIELFTNASYRQPPAGAGECAAPKLLQYAFQHSLKPIAMAEFWWGLSPKSASWKHGHFYAPCIEKCQPILAHMLS